MNLKNVIQRGDKFFVVSTVYAWDVGQYETMVFPCNSDGRVTDYCDLAVKRYKVSADATQGHELMTRDFMPQEQA